MNLSRRYERGWRAANVSPQVTTYGRTNCSDCLISRSEAWQQGELGHRSRSIESESFSSDTHSRHHIYEPTPSTKTECPQQTTQREQS
jgi:hypothetical protein